MIDGSVSLTIIAEISIITRKEAIRVSPYKMIKANSPSYDTFLKIKGYKKMMAKAVISRNTKAKR